jgi:hypothetical protein
MKTFNIRHVFTDHGKYYPTSFFQKLYDRLLVEYPDYEFIIENNPSYKNNGLGSIYSCLNFSIINPENNKYILLSFFDNWRYHFMKHIGWDPANMTQFFYPGGFNHLEYFYFKNSQKSNADVYCPNNIDTIYQSFYYSSYEVNDEEKITNLYDARNLQYTIPELYFCGQMWDFRKEMIKHIKDPSISIVSKSNKYVSYYDHLNYLIHYRCSLSLPGGTEMCNRDIENFSIGVPVIRPNISISYDEPLIPNYHYISCYDNCKYWNGYPSYISYKDFALSVVDTWHRVKDNLDYLEFVSKNARLWYLKNCRIDNNMDYVLSKINMELLYD